MQFTHLPGNKATPLLVLLACYIGVVCAGAIPTNYNRHDNDPRSPPSATNTHTNLDRTSATTGHEVEVPKSKQRTLSVKGKRTHEMPAEVADWFQDNGTEAQQRVIRQASAGAVRTCTLVRPVIHEEQGQCIHVGGMVACSTATHMDLNHADCTTTR